ncbi:MAG TPA: DUF1326 domain-containing protein [Gemmataceae bacterium]|jgi:hypothetical protein
MSIWLLSTALVFVGAADPAKTATVSGTYIEARTCDVWTGPCFANAEMNIGGKHAILGWRVEKGSLNDVRLDGLSVVAVIATSDTLGLEQTGPSKAVLIVDEKATKDQKVALIRFAKEQGGDLTKNVIGVESAAVEFTLCDCKEGGCAKLQAGSAKIETRCLEDKHDKVCGNESAFYPPLVKSVQAKPAVAVGHGYAGKAFKETWSETDRRGAYLGSFAVR